MKVMKPFCANAKYHTLGELPPELQFDPICKLRGRGQTTITFSPSAMSSGGMIFSWSLWTGMKFALPSGSNKRYCLVDA